MILIPAGQARHAESRCGNRLRLSQWAWPARVGRGRADRRRKATRGAWSTRARGIFSLPARVSTNLAHLAVALLGRARDVAPRPGDAIQTSIGGVFPALFWRVRAFAAESAARLFAVGRLHCSVSAAGTSRTGLRGRGCGEKAPRARRARCLIWSRGEIALRAVWTAKVALPQKFVLAHGAARAFLGSSCFGRGARETSRGVTLKGVVFRQRAVCAVVCVVVRIARRGQVF